MNASQVVSLNNALSLSQRPEEAARVTPGDRAELFDFVAMLQTTLDRSRVLDIFATRVQRVLAVRGIRFEFNQAIIGACVDAYRFGALDDGKCLQVGIHAGERVLGTLQVFTSETISAGERREFDRLLGCLVHPLQNAMLYSAATHQAHSDPLTGLGNRAAYDKAIEREVARAQRNDGPFSLLVVDLDAFKQLNDTHGHLAGDAALRRIARTLGQQLRESDQLFRMGGDEFVVILPDARKGAAAEVAQRLTKAVLSECTQPQLSISVGHASWQQGLSSVDLFDMADRALYAEKNAA